MDSPKNNTYKAIFTFQDFTSALDFPEVNMQITFGEVTKTVPLPFKEALLIEATEVSQNSKVQFQLEEPDGDLVGYSELKVPASIFTAAESEVNQQLLFQLVKGSNSSVITNTCVIFLTKKGSKDKKSQPQQRLSVKPPQAQVIGTISLSPQKNKKTTPQKHRLSDYSPIAKKVPSAETQSQNFQNSRSDKNLNGSFLEDTTLFQSHFELDSPTSAKGQRDTHSSKFDSPNRPTPNRVTITPSNNSRASPSASPTRSPNNARKSVMPVTTPTEFSPKNHQGQQRFSLIETVKKLTSEAEIEKKNASDLLFQEQTEFIEERQLPEVFATLEQQLGDRGYLRAHVDFLKNSMITLDFKINEINMVKSENNNLAQEAQRAVEAKDAAEAQMATATFQLREENELLKAQIADLLARNEALNAKNQETQEECFKAKTETLKVAMNLNQKENELNEALLKNAEITETKYQLKRSHDSLARVEVQRAEDQKNFMEALARLKRELEDTRIILEKSFQEKKELVIQLTQEKLAHQDARSEIVIIQRRLENAETYKEAVASLEVQRDEFI